MERVFWIVMVAMLIVTVAVGSKPEPQRSAKDVIVDEVVELGRTVWTAGSMTVKGWVD